MKGIFDFQEITMLPLPQRHSLIAETAAVLRQRIEAGEWPLHLPGELDLAALLQVGRNTLRSALALLEGEGYLVRPVTALYVLHADHCVTALSFLQHAGLTIPDDISLICRDDAPYLSLLCPEPARYRHSTATFSSRLASLVRQFDDTTAGKRRPALIMPSAIEGATLALVRQ